MFLDASALVAILGEEPGWDVLLDRLATATTPPITSALAIFETVTALCRKKAISIETAEADVRSFLTAAAIAVVPIADPEARFALSAFKRYGRGQGHPAQLNLADCFAYACAKHHGVPLLFVGDDFSRTDILSAMA